MTSVAINTSAQITILFATVMYAKYNIKATGLVLCKQGTDSHDKEPVATSNTVATHIYVTYTTIEDNYDMCMIERHFC